MSTATLCGVAIGAIGAGVAFYVLRRVVAPNEIKLSYFDVAAAPGEKIRLALHLNGIKFTDNRIKFPDWKALKPKTKYGKLPILECDGKEMYQSGAMLRYVGRLGDGSLYPVADVELCFKIEEMLGVSDDLAGAWNPALYLGMGRHTSFGYPEEWADKDKTVKTLREKFVAEELPKFMQFLSNELEKTGAFLCGAAPTIADCQLVPQVHYFTRGVADHVPKDCLSSFPAVLAWMKRFHELPQLQAYYASK